MKFNISDRIKIKTKDKEFEGISMPSSDENYEIIKLDNGYNLDILKKNISKIELIEKSKPIIEVISEKNEQDDSLPKITILHTGGTIASKVDYKTGGTVSRFTPKEILAMFPELKNYANINSRLIENMWSQDMRFSHYNLIAKEVKKELDRGVKGVIVTQGTDTMHYTSAALSFILEGLASPVILVGAQRSSDRGSSDAYMNLINAVYFIVHSDFGEVGICMHANTDDDFCHILPATKTRKFHTSRRDAFRPINTLPWAEVSYGDKHIKYLLNNYKIAGKNQLKIKLIKKDIKVALMKQHTNMYADQFLFYKNYEGLVIEATGLGCLPITEIDESTKESGKIFCAIEELIKNGVIVVEAPQAINGRIVMNVYSDQRKAQQMGVLGNFSDMTPETSFIKLAWLLSNYSKDETKTLITQNLRGEITDRINPKSYLYKKNGT